MAIQEREQLALEVYIKLLTRKGFGPETFVQRINFLNRLMPLLADKAQGGGEYRLSLETLMDKVAEVDWPESLVIAREYYPFWANDLKAVANLSKSVTKDTLPIDWKPTEVALVTLWHAADQENDGASERRGRGKAAPWAATPRCPRTVPRASGRGSFSLRGTG